MIVKEPVQRSITQNYAVNECDDGATCYVICYILLKQNFYYKNSVSIGANILTNIIFKKHKPMILPTHMIHQIVLLMDIRTSQQCFLVFLTLKLAILVNDVDV